MPKPGLTTDEVAKLLNVTPKRVRELVRENLLDAHELLPRLWYYSFDAVERCRLALRAAREKK
jgi:excisionase family DNA binding protein